MNHFLNTTLKSVDESSGTWTSVANASGVLDRDNERVMPRALIWKTATVPVHVDHRFTVETLVGRGRPYYDANGMLLIDGKFNTSEMGQATRRKVLDGSLDSMSIVMHDTKREQAADGVMEIVGGELIACDWVTIPSNYESRVLAARGYEPCTVGEAHAALFSTGATVAEARRFAMQTIMQLAELDLADARRGFVADPDPADLDAVLADAKQFLAELSRPATAAPPRTKASKPRPREIKCLYDVLAARNAEAFDEEVPAETPPIPTQTGRYTPSAYELDTGRFREGR